MLKRGSTGSAVKELQKKLGITADGIFGPATEAALIAWQKKNGLAADGIYGPASKAKMTGGSSSGGGAAAGGGKSDQITDAQTWASGMGYSVAFFNSDPDLKKLLNEAISTSPPMAQDLFIAKLRNTPWYRKHSESYRKWFAMSKSDPNTLAQMTAQTRSTMANMAWQMGALVPGAQMAKLAEQALQFGWDENQMRSAMLAFIKVNKGGAYQGQAASNAEKYKQIADSYGVTLSTAQLGSFVQNSIRGTVTDQYVQQWAASQAASRYPALAQQLKAGHTLAELVDPYIQSYAKTLELNPETIKLSDPTLQKALTAKDSKGNPAVKTIWQFEQDLRNDPRWNKTQQAQDDVMSTARKVLQDFGFSQ